MTKKSHLFRLLAMTVFLFHLYTIGQIFRQENGNKEADKIRQVMLGDFANETLRFISHNDGNATSTEAMRYTMIRDTKHDLPPVQSEVTNNSTISLPLNFVPGVYLPGSWDGAPIVIEEYKLLFFTQGKVACTEFKKLFRRMMHLKDWRLHKEPKIPHNPQFNGLNYLYHYSLSEALHMLTDPRWTRAIFVRDPKERLLSAYLDKAAKKYGRYVDRHCCPSESNEEDSCGRQASESLLNFLRIIRDRCCCDAHWKPQAWRIDQELWEYINYVGYFDSLAADTQQMLQQLGAWKEFGFSGWGESHNESIFMEPSRAKHQTGAGNKLSQYFNSSVGEKLLLEFYSDDYRRFAFQP